MAPKKNISQRDVENPDQFQQKSMTLGDFIDDVTLGFHTRGTKKAAISSATSNLRATSIPTKLRTKPSLSSTSESSMAPLFLGAREVDVLNANPFTHEKSDDALLEGFSSNPLFEPMNVPDDDDDCNSAWGLDVVGPITPKSSAGHAYILAGTDYFSKWAEAVALREVKKENVVDFVRNYIIYRYGVPRYIITDNGIPFCNRLMTSLCEKFKFAQRKSSMYNAPANGLAEAFNKTLCTLLSKVVSKHKRDWHDKLGEALWAYRTTYKTPTQSTPYALVYGVESILPLEIQIPSLRIAIQEDLTAE
ncbi:hypothetical protein BVRB_2g047610 [Beta vulgaris subsp. vulgaris]|nr:hypothetical protein BVRB_2g047610 [Beta vulgaris subsp. vulgaris]